MLRIFWFEVVRCFAFWVLPGMYPLYDTGYPGRKALVSCLLWYPVIWGVRVRGIDLKFLGNEGSFFGGWG